MSVDWHLKRLEMLVVQPFAACLPRGGATEHLHEKRWRSHKTRQSRKLCKCVSWDCVLFNCLVFFSENKLNCWKNNAVLATKSKSDCRWNDKGTSNLSKMPPLQKTGLARLFSSHQKCHFFTWGVISNGYIVVAEWKWGAVFQAFERHRLWHEKSRGLDQLDVWGKESRPCVCLIGASLIGLFWTAGHDTSHEYCLWPKTNIPHALIAG